MGDVCFGISLEEGRYLDPSEFFERIASDLLRSCTDGNDINLKYKNFQAWQTERRVMMLLGPNRTPMENYEKHGWKMLSDLEKEMVRKYPTLYPPEIHSKGTFPRMQCFLDWGKGGHWVDPDSKVRGEDTTHRKVPTYIYAKDDEERILKIVRACKERRLEQKIFGQHAHWQVLPPGNPNKFDRDVKTDLDDYYLDQGGCQMSLGHVTLTGIKNPNIKVKVYLEPDEDGERESPGLYSVMDLLMKIFAGRTRVFQAILLGREGKYVGFHSGIDKVAETMAIEIGEDVGSWLKIMLIKQGWKMECIADLIGKSFTPEAANSASLAKYDKAKGKVISGSQVKRMAGHAAMAKAGIIDRTLGYTPSEREAIRERMGSTLGKGNVSSEFGAGSFGAFKFGSDMSIQTLNPGVKGNVSVAGATYNLDKTSKYSVLSDESLGLGFGDFDSDEESDGDTKMGNVEVELPAGGLEGMNKKDDTEMNEADNSKDSKADKSGMEEDEDSKLSEISPTFLNDRFGNDSFGNQDDGTEEAWESFRDADDGNISGNNGSTGEEEGQAEADMQEPAQDVEGDGEDSRPSTNQQTNFTESLNATLTSTEGSHAEKEKALRDALARLLSETGNNEATTHQPTNVQNESTTPNAASSAAKSSADEASVTAETSIPTNTAHRRPDKDQERHENPSAGEGEGLDVGHTMGDDSSVPG